MNFVSSDGNHIKSKKMMTTTTMEMTCMLPEKPRFLDMKIATKRSDYALLKPIQEQYYEHSAQLFNTQTSKAMVNPPCTNGNKQKWFISKIPLFYPLARSSIVIPSAIQLETLVARISIFLRMSSIQVTFHPQKGRMDCLTSTMLKFSLQLWRQSENELSSSSASSPSSSPSDWLLEVQRRRGCSMEMRCILKDLFPAVQHGREYQSSSSSGHPMRKVPSLRRQRPKLVESNNSHGRDIRETMRICLQLLESDFHDQNRLGMESLRNSTDSNIVQPELAKALCQAVLHAEGDLGERLQKLLFGWMVTCPSTSSAAVCESEVEHHDDEENNNHDPTDGEDMLHWHTMHSLSLRVLANALEETIAEGTLYNGSLIQSLSTLSAKNDDSIFGQVMKRLMSNLEMASDRPKHAAISAKCLRLLSLGKDGLLSINPNFEQILLQAYQHGQSHHCLLEKECESLIV